jgi:hypothetical protein
LTDGELLGSFSQGGKTLLDCLRPNLRKGCRLRQHWQLSSSVFGTGRRLGPAKLLNPARDHLLGLRRPAKFRGTCSYYPLGCLAVRLPSQGASDTNTNRNQEAGKPS